MSLILHTGPLKVTSNLKSAFSFFLQYTFLCDWQLNSVELHLFWVSHNRTKRAAVFRPRCKRLSCSLQEHEAPLKGAQRCDTHTLTCNREWALSQSDSQRAHTLQIIPHPSPSLSLSLSQAHTHTETCDIVAWSLLSNIPTLSISHKLRHAQSQTECCSVLTSPCLHCVVAGKRTASALLAGWSEGLWRRKG